MKVLLIGTAGKYGAQLSLVHLSRELKNRGLEVEVVIPNKGETDILYEQEGIPCHIIKNGLMWYNPKQNIFKRYLIYVAKIIINLVAEFRVGILIRKKSIDIVHINSIGVGIGARSAKRLNRKLVWHIREFVEEDLNRKLFSKKKTYSLLNSADAIITISDAVRQYYANVINNNKMHTVYNGIDCSFNLERNNDILSNGKVRIIVSGRICKEKGQYIVLDALHYLNKYIDFVTIDFCGDSNGDNTELDNLVALVKKNGWNNIVSFSGYCNSMAEKYREADICIVPSKMEAFGRVSVEAMLSGCLVIGSESGGTKELLQNDRGILFTTGDSKDLAEKISWAIENKDNARKISKSAYIYAKGVFTSQKNADNVLKIYNKVK